MFKSKLLLLTLVFVFILSACAPAPAAKPAGGEVSAEATPESSTPILPETEVDRETLMVYVDGQPVRETGYAYADVKPALSDHEINDGVYYAAPLQNIVGQDLSPIKGAFLEAVDGYVSYVKDINNLYLAAYKADAGQYQSIELDGKAVYAGIVLDGKETKGVSRVYLVTTPAAFEVEIQKNGEKIGVLAVKEFMQKTEVDGKKVATALFDGSYLYNYGESTYSGKFLGVDYKTMLAKLNGLGMDLSGNIMEVEFYGSTALGKEGKNMEYSAEAESDKYFGLVDFYCMYDGKTFNNDTADLPVGLTAFINGTGGRWMTMNLTTINFIVE
ncbi:MAG: hypothetical protein IT308_08870 [Anaerolineaceae bacterium]|nr:hypothetical protein [Anaerolineaceae bacterium]